MGQEAESFFSNLKSERVKKRIYRTRADAKSDIFDYIEGLYNRIRRHKLLNHLSPFSSRDVKLHYEKCLRYWGECHHKKNTATTTGSIEYCKFEIISTSVDQSCNL